MTKRRNRYTRKRRRKASTSKLYVWIADVHFILQCVVIGPLLVKNGFDTSLTITAITAAGTIAAASRAFYFNKAKAENLSKQRIRYVLMKLLLEEKLPPPVYVEICSEIDNIDCIIDQKLTGMVSMAVDTEAIENTY